MSDLTPDQWLRFDELIDSLRPLSPQIRANRLDELRAVEESIVIRLVEEELRRPPLEDESLDSMLRYKKGDQIGHQYLVDKAIAGGVSEVYLCWHIESDEAFALKTFQARSLSERNL